MLNQGKIDWALACVRDGEEKVCRSFGTRGSEAGMQAGEMKGKSSLRIPNFGPGSQREEGEYT